ncbi:MAG: hypothetical protein EP338_06665 [Bacteroidetes bacterium]|nr:MAG: hypothetical protein EP338_06665 [Bacteroidota bacterium]
MKKLIWPLCLGLLIASCKKEENNNDNNQDPGGSGTPAVFDVVGQLSFSDGPHDIAIKDHVLFACRGDNIQIVNISNPSSPTLIGTLEYPQTTNNFEALYLDGNTLYIGCSAVSGIYAMDVTDPEAPTALAQYTDDIFAGTKLKTYSIFAQNGQVWAAGSNGQGSMLVRFDLQSGNLILKNFWEGGGTGNAVEGIWGNSTHIYLSTADGHVLSFDQANFTSGPLDDFTFQAEAGHEHWGRTLVGKGNSLYWADWGAGFVTLDISNPSSLVATTTLSNSVYIGQHPDAEGTNVYDVALDDASGKIYLANGWSGLLELNQSTPGQVNNYVDYKDNQYYCLKVSGDYAYVGDIAAGTTDIKGIKVIKIK